MFGGRVQRIFNFGTHKGTLAHTHTHTHTHTHSVLIFIYIFLATQMVKNLPVMQETWVGSLGREVPLEKEGAIHFSIPAWRIPWTEKPEGLQSMGLQRLRHDWLTNPCIQFSSVAQLSPTLCNPVDCSMPGFPVCHHSQSLLKLMSIQSVMPSNHLIFCSPLSLLSSIFPSIRVFSNESVLPIRWPKYWNFSFSISPSNECSGLISFKMDWLDLLAVQGSLTSLLQQHSLLAKLITKTVSKVFIDQIFFLLSSILF